MSSTDQPINLADATIDWLETHLSGFALSNSIARTTAKARECFLSHKLGIDAEEASISTSRISFHTTDGLGVKALTTLMQATIVHEEIPFALESLGSTGESVEEWGQSYVRHTIEIVFRPKAA